MAQMASDCRLGQWDQEFVDSVSFRESPIVAAPDVTEMPLHPDDEFLVIASDGLWCGLVESTFHFCSLPCTCIMQHTHG